MGTRNKQFAGCQGRSGRDNASPAPLHQKPPAPARGSLYVPMLPRVQFSPSLALPWQRERAQRLARIFRCMERGQAAGKRLHEMQVWFAWRWKGRHYKSDPARRIRFSRGTLGRLYRRWNVIGGNAAALALNYRAPRKLRPGLAEEFARVCINSDVRSFTEAHGRLPRPVASWYAYRLSLPPMLRGRVVGLFAARRLEACRAHKARAAANWFAKRGAR